MFLGVRTHRKAKKCNIKVFYRDGNERIYEDCSALNMLLNVPQQTLSVS